MTKLIRDEKAKEILDMLENTNNSFFLTWKAGTGKSTLIKEFMKKTNKNVLVLAPTGIAAINVWWQTIHSLLNFNPKTTPQNVSVLYGDKKNL